MTSASLHHSYIIAYVHQISALPSNHTCCTHEHTWITQNIFYIAPRGWVGCCFCLHELLWKHWISLVAMGLLHYISISNYNILQGCFSLCVRLSLHCLVSCIKHRHVIISTPFWCITSRVKSYRFERDLFINTANCSYKENALVRWGI